MKPHRIRMTHNLLLNYGLYRSMEIYVSSMSFSFVFFYCRFPLIKSALLSQRPHKANNDDMTKYHSDDYIRFLKSIRPDNMSEHSKQMQRCECGPPGLTSEASLSVSNIQHLCLSLCSQSTLVKTAPCSTACLSFVSSPLVDLLVGHRSLPQLQIACKGPVCMICLHV